MARPAAVSRRFFLGALGAAAAGALLPAPPGRVVLFWTPVTPQPGAFVAALRLEVQGLIWDMTRAQERFLLDLDRVPARPARGPRVKVRRAPGQLKKSERKKLRKALWRRQN